MEQQVQVADPRIIFLTFGELDVAVGVLVAQSRDKGRQDDRRDTLEGPDVDAAVARSEPLDGISQAIRVSDQRLTVLVDQLAECREPSRPGPARPVEQRTAD